MNILLVNDDGYGADGIKILEEVLVSHGHDVYVSAPTSEQSAKSHAMTIYGSRYATEYRSGHFHIDGTPADCIIYGLHSGLIPVNPDVVISGINHGYNLSTDIIYSGTCGAARQAAFYGYKAIAISTYKGNDGVFRFSDCAEFLSANMDTFLSHLRENAFININIPPDFDGRFDYASVGEIQYHDKFSIEKVSNHRFKITNIDCDIEFKTRNNAKHKNDFELCSSGIASVSYIDLFPQCSLSHMESLQ